MAIGTQAASASGPVAPGERVEANDRVPLIRDTGRWAVLATFVHADPAQSQALVSIAGQPAALLKEGARLDAATTLRGIHPQRIVVDTGGRLVAIPLGGRVEGGDARPRPVARVVDHAGAAAASAPAAAAAPDALRQLCGSRVLRAALSEAQREELVASGACAGE